MSGQNSREENILVKELSGHSDQKQADMIAEHYADISNQYEPIKEDDFLQFKNRHFCPPVIEYK